MKSVQPGLAGLRVLVVEDEFLISLLIKETLVAQHCTVIGPFDRVFEALEAARSQAIDLAVLDVNVAGTQVYPVADVLAAREIPFVFLSGYGDDAIPFEHPEWRVCSKPFRSNYLLGMLAEQVRPAN